MKLVRTRHFLDDYRSLPPPLRKKVDQKLIRLLSDHRYPGLAARKMVNQPAIWEARIDAHTRLTFQWEKDVVVLRRVGTHAIYRKP